jgi:4-hydroxybutyrate CoA-transferase
MGGRWQDDYRSKCTNAAEAVSHVRPHDVVYMGGNAATPRALAHALADRGADLDGLRVAHVLLLGEDPFARPPALGRIRHLSWFVGPADRRALLQDHGDYVPAHLSEIPGLMRAGNPAIDTALLMTAPPDRHGMLSLGVEVLASLAAAHCARRVCRSVAGRSSPSPRRRRAARSRASWPGSPKGPVS